MRTKRVVVALAAIVVPAVVLRAVAPIFVQRYVNRALADLGEYSGSVATVDLSVLRGGYTLHQLEIVKTSGAVESPFVPMPRMELSLQWPALLSGKAVGEAESQYGTGVNWPQEVRDLFPFQPNVVRVIDGLATFRAPGIAAEESMTAREVQLELRNLTNVDGVEEQAFASLDAAARVMGTAPFTLRGEIDPNESVPTFDVDLWMSAVQGSWLAWPPPLFLPA